MLILEKRGIPEWRSGLTSAFGPGSDPGDPGSNPTSGSRCMEPASPSACASASLSLCVTIIKIKNKKKKNNKKEEISNLLPDKECKIMVIKMLTLPIIDKHSDNFNKERKKIRAEDHNS